MPAPVFVCLAVHASCTYTRWKNCTRTERGKVNARRSVFTVMQPRHDYVYAVNRTYKHEIRIHERAGHPRCAAEGAAAGTWDGADGFRDRNETP